MKNGAETDIDCGGACATKCATGKACGVGADCASSVCSGNVCQAATCANGAKNGSETDVDCGGAACPKCVNGKVCTAGTDCSSGICTAGICTAPAPTCVDGVKNGTETDIDCGGDKCNKCGLGLACGGNSDCGVGICSANKCISNKSCKALHDGDPLLKDGKYMLDPDEGGPNAAFEAYCDMSHDGGGWTLIMKSINTNFLYDDVLWENNATLNPTDFDFMTDAKKSKYQTFMTVGFGAIRSSVVDGSSAQIYTLGAPVASATALFTGPGVEVNKTMLSPYFEGIHVAYDKHLAVNGCNPSTKYVNYGINLKKLNGVAFLPDGGQCDWNGGARFGLRVNGNHNGTGNHAGQGWGTYTTIDANYVAKMTQLLWVR